MLRMTPIVRNLLAVNVLVALVAWLLPALHVREYLWLYNFRYPDFRPYQLFTYMFVHDGLGHIFFNMLGLVFVGPILETHWGSMRFLSFYIIVGIGAGVFNIAVDLAFGYGSFSVMMGASGAVYGLLTAFGYLFPNMEVRLLFPPIPMKAKYLVIGLGCIALYSGLRSAPGDNVAHFTHLGGIAVALVLLIFWK